MKSLVLCACVLIIAFQSSSSSELKNRLKSAIESNIANYAEACLTENDMTGVDRYTEEDIMTNLHAKPENAERTRKNGCMILCVLKKQNLMEGTNIKEAQVHAKINETLNDPSDHGPVRAEAHRIARKCIKKDDMLTVQDVIHDRHKESENQEKIKKNGCVLQCILEKFGIMEGSEYDVEKMRSETIKGDIDESTKLKLLEGLNNCINETKDLTEKCEKSFDLVVCGLKSKEKIYASRSENQEEHEHKSEK